MFYDEYLFWCQQAGKSPSGVAREIGISDASPTNWKKQGMTPPLKTLKKLADYFGITIDELCDHTKSYPATDAEEIQDELFEKRKLLFDLSKKATAEDLELFIKMMKGIIDE